MKKYKTNTARIPTVLGLGLLFTALFLGISIFLYQQELSRRTMLLLSPKNTLVSNITDSSANIIWETGSETSGSLIWGSDNLNNNASDTRDSSVTKARLIHQVNLNQLLPETTYNFQIKSNNYLSPSQQTFRTLKRLIKDDIASNKPLSGKVLTTQLEPAQESVVLLKLKDSLPLATITSTAGNFILSLNDLRTLDGSFVNLAKPTLAELEIRGTDQVSRITLSIPQENPLPPFILGQDRDLTKEKVASSSPLVIAKKYDLNGDGKVNSVDLSIVISAIDKKGENPADFNNDKVVDSKDLNLLKKELEK